MECLFLIKLSHSKMVINWFEMGIEQDLGVSKRSRFCSAKPWWIAAGDSWSLEKFDFMLSMGVDCSVEMPHSRWQSNPTSHSKDWKRISSLIFNVDICWYQDMQRYGHIVKSAWDPNCRTEPGGTWMITTTLMQPQVRSAPASRCSCADASEIWSWSILEPWNIWVNYNELTTSEPWKS